MLAARITLLLAAVAALTAQGALAQTTYNSVADAATALGLTSLLEAVQAANLTTTLQDPSFQGIVLAPSNAAFQNLSSNATGNSLQSVLLYHVLKTNQLPTALPAYIPSLLPSSDTTNGNVTLQATGDSNVLLALGVAPGANVQLNSSATTAGGNATVYVIDKVLLPPSKSDIPLKTESFLTVLEAVNSTQDLSMLLQLAAGFPDIANTLSDKDVGCTVFAPNNAAFAAFNASIAQGAQPSQQVMQRVLQNHIVRTPILSTQIPASPTTVPTVSNDTLTVMNENGNVTVMSSSATNATVVAADIKAGKCVVHIVNEVLAPVGAGAASNTCWLAVVADADGPAPPVGSGPRYQNVSAALAGLPGFTQLAGLLNNASLTGALDNITGIIFAPTDAAFGNLTSGLSQEYITTVLRYHVVPTNISMQMLNTTPPVLATLAPPQPPANYTGITPTITVTSVSETEALLSSIAPGVLVNLTNSVTAGNARIYPIDSVLIPPTTPPLANLTVAGFAQANAASQNLTFFASLVQNDTDVAALASNPDTAATVFAPNDAAFNALLAQLNASGTPLPGSGSAEAHLVLLTHVLPRPWTAASLPNGTTIVQTLSGQNVTITKNGTSVSVQGPGNQQPIPVVVVPDLLAGKSVVHVINGVIIPNFATPVPSPAPAPGFVAPPPGGAGISTNFPPPAPGAATAAATSTPLMVLSALLGALMMVAMAAGSRV